MTRGTTPIFKIVIRGIDDLSEFTAGQVIIRQGAVVISRDLSESDVTSNYIRIQLTQQETLRFAHTRPAWLQVRIQNAAGVVKASESVQLTVEPIQDEAVMPNE